MFKGQACKYVTGKLTYLRRNCGVENEVYTIYKNGTQTARITLPIAGVHPTYLYLKKQQHVIVVLHIKRQL